MFEAVKRLFRRREAKDVALRGDSGQRVVVRDLSAQQYNVIKQPNANEPYWSFATGADANQTATPWYRRDIRNRARMEILNNSYARGMTLTLANDIVGSGPRLQLIAENGAQEAANEVERLWRAWCEESQFYSKMQTAKVSKTVDGEVFMVMETNGKYQNGVQLDVKLYEADQFSDPYEWLWFGVPLDVRYPPYDGIVFDEWGNPKTYYRQKHHPGSLYGFTLTGEDWEPIPAEFVIHLYRVDRPGQYRGVSEIVSVLDLFVDLRDYTDAAVNGAQQSASMTAAMKTDMPPGESDEVTDPVCTSIPIPKNTMFNLPYGWDLQQMRTEQPTTQYGDFVMAVLREVARCLQIPVAVAAGDSSNHNYASGRLDWQVYYKAIDVERSYLERSLLNRVWRAWLAEAQLIPGFLPPGFNEHATRWIWDGRAPVDPLKEAQATVALFNHGLLLEPHYWQERYGVPMDEAMRMLKQGIDIRKDNELPLPSVLVTQLSQAPDEERADLAKTGDGDEEE
jgi:lambda family phage portal protein